MSLARIFFINSRPNCTIFSEFNASQIQLDLCPYFKYSNFKVLLFYFTCFLSVAGGACGGILQRNIGWFSPVNDIDELYDNNLDCQWFVQVDGDLRVHLTFQYLHIQDSEACQLDFVQVILYLLNCSFFFICYSILSQLFKVQFYNH